MCAIFIGKDLPNQYSASTEYSEENMRLLFDNDKDEGIPHAVHIGAMTDNDAISSAVADYTCRNVDENSKDELYNELLMENVGYTSGDNSPQAFLTMKSTALERCLTGKPFLASGTGSSMVPDFQNPSILTWLFPHLDPWGIGGFYHPGRKIKISMEEQLKHLLLVDDSPFAKDPEFAFIFYNICRKALVSQSLRFLVSQSSHKKIANELLNIDLDMLSHLTKECEKNPYYKPTETKEKEAFRLLSSIRLVSKHVPGSDGYKLTLRNQIRALINNKGTPTLFITINPSDVDNPIRVRIFHWKVSNEERTGRNGEDHSLQHGTLQDVHVFLT
ncbi:hypothetical protein JR316_0001686 [Psilocybe cubensis]|uniref:Uncharacterized protein n=1 Tax=Psilocybe cubensis TaxID=181762 RepID=A0ACB8HAT7_PSICU|nr:hypothetical protein JR316_0001686 [Psilocybe cubensis]KAH9484784.1 hypothetical protein JR316_0001686 [Psilocybe cubensis]